MGLYIGCTLMYSGLNTRCTLVYTGLYTELYMGCTLDSSLGIHCTVHWAVHQMCPRCVLDYTPAVLQMCSRYVLECTPDVGQICSICALDVCWICTRYAPDVPRCELGLDTRCNLHTGMHTQTCTRLYTTLYIGMYTVTLNFTPYTGCTLSVLEYTLW